MLKIQPSPDDGVVVELIGRIDVDQVSELQRLLSLEFAGRRVSLDLRDVTLIDRDLVRVFALWEKCGIRLVNCPAYIRTMVDSEKE